MICRARWWRHLHAGLQKQCAHGRGRQLQPPGLRRTPATMGPAAWGSAARGAPARAASTGTVLTDQATAARPGARVPLGPAA